MGLKVRHASYVGGDEEAGGGEVDLGEVGGEGVLRAVAPAEVVAGRGGEDEVATAGGFQVGLGTVAGVFTLGAWATALLAGGCKLALTTLPERWRWLPDDRELPTLAPSSSVASTDFRAKAEVRMSAVLGWRVVLRRTILAATSE